MAVQPRGKVVIVSGPSGAGKTTVIQEVFRRSKLPLVRSISATTRPPRAGETNGVDYHFLSVDEFQNRRDKGEFLECCEVFKGGDWYGTLRSEVATGLSGGKWVVLVIDVQGAESVRKAFPDAVSIFIHPGSLDILERRLRSRGPEAEAVIQCRLARARQELELASQYGYVVVNDDLDRAVGEVCELLSQESEADRNA